MANKLNAFLASVPANGLPSPVRQHGAAPGSAASLPTLQTSFPELSLLKAAPATPLPRSHAAQPATPQPQQQRRHANRRAKKFETHFHKSESARNLSLPAASVGSSTSTSRSDCKDSDAAVNGSSSSNAVGSNQDEIEQHKQRQQAISPLKAFNPKQQQRTSSSSSSTNASDKQLAPALSGESEAGPLRRLSAQGSHHRRVSTDTTMFNRYLRQQADRDINMGVVQHFSAVPVVTLSRSAATVASVASGNSKGVLDSDAELDNNNNNSCGDASDNSSSSSDDAYNSVAVVDPNTILAVFQRGGAVSTASALEILKLATNVMSLESNVITIQAPYTLVGDLHGQFQDLLEIFRVHGAPSATNPFLFLGDYVDRGVASCEIVLLLLAFKVAFPSSVHLLRGNHECRSLSTFYGFRNECLLKYGTLVYNRMIKCFESMPLAAKLETSYGVFLAVHGGLSPEIGDVEDINDQVNRFMEPEPNGALCDLLWSDPAKESSAQTDAWAPNSVRGCSFTFNERACRDFLARNGLLAIIRAHELEEDGFREHFGGSHATDKRRVDATAATEADDSDALTLPPVITVFSAPEYCNTNLNMGATLSIPWEKRRANVLEYRQHKRSVQREHEFTLASEDQAVKMFLRETLPFLPVDFYDLVTHCRQLKQMLMLSRQSSMTQLATAASAIQSVLADTSTTSQGSSKSAFALELDSEIRSPTFAAVTIASPNAKQCVDVDATLNRKSHSSESEELARSGHSTTEEPSGAETEAQGSATLFAKASARSSRSSRRKQQHKSRQETPAALAPVPATAPATLHPLGNVQVLTRSGSTAALKPAPPQRSHRPFFEAAEDNNNYNNSNDDASPRRGGSRNSLTAVPMNNQLNSSDDVGSPASSPSAVSLLSPLSLSSDATQSHLSLPSPQSTEAPMQLESVFPGHKPKGSDIFSKREWQALKLYFTLLDVSGNGVLMEESFVVLLAEQDSDAYATEDELTLLMEVIDTNADGLITEQDFLLFAYRSYLRWTKLTHKTLALS